MSRMSMWDQYDMQERIRAILDVRYNDPDHHLGRPFLTPYQIAVAFKERHRADFEAIGKEIGGTGTGHPTSFAQYIARELSTRIEGGSIQGIAGGFLSSSYGLVLECTDPDTHESIRSSAKSYDVSIYRRTD